MHLNISFGEASLRAYATFLDFLTYASKYISDTHVSDDDDIDNE